jgi:hypothetical protein
MAPNTMSTHKSHLQAEPSSLEVISTIEGQGRLNEDSTRASCSFSIIEILFFICFVPSAAFCMSQRFFFARDFSYWELVL